MTGKCTKRVDVERLRGFIETAKQPGDLSWELIECEVGNWLAANGDALLQQLADQTKQLAECFRQSGADCDGDEDWRIASRAVRAVGDLRRDYDEACGEADNLRKKLAEQAAEIERVQSLLSLRTEALHEWEHRAAKAKRANMEAFERLVTGNGGKS